jgi:glyoxylase-like metal-dependent hydrolase (beta-lactamase superfamily II)
VPEYEVAIVKYGNRSTTRSDVYLNYPIYHTPDSPIEMDYFFWVVRNADRTVLVDTGFSEQGGHNRHRTMLIDPMEACARLGIDPASAPTVVVTHAHYDHVGNLAKFPGSDIVIAEKELTFWATEVSRNAQFQHAVEDDELAALRAAYDEGRVVTFAGRHEVAPGIEVLEVGGHTPGQSVVKVETGDGAVLLASDSIHYYEEYEHNMPFMAAANLVDMYLAYERVRAMVSSGEVDHVVSGHDPSTLQRFRPAHGELRDVVATIGGPT